VRCVGGWLRPDLQFAFQCQVCQTHRTHRTQGNIFADVPAVSKEQGLGGGLTYRGY